MRIRLRECPLLLFATLLLLFHAGSARANGRFPHAQSLKELGQGTLALSGTYGLLLTTNAGADWYLVCEQMLFGRAAGWPIDPLFELSSNAIVSGSPHAVRVSRDLGCTWSTHPDLPVDPLFFDETTTATANDVGVTIDLTPVRARGADHLLALVAATDAQGLVYEHRLYETTDGAVTFRAIGAPIPRSSAYPLFTVDVAPSDPARVYASGVLGQTPVLLASRDGGESWRSTEISIDDAAALRGAYIAAITADDPDRLYVRVPRWTESADASIVWDDSLLFSDDGGATFTEVLRRNANLLGFALSPDGSSVVAGYGDPQMLGVASAAADLGIYAADTSNHAFEQVVGDLAVSCLSWTPAGLYACAAERDPLGTDPSLDPDFHLGLYSGSGLPASRSDFEPLLKLKDVRGVLPWSDGRPSECTSDWCSSLPVCPAGGMEPPIAPGAQVCLATASGGAGGSAGNEPLDDAPSGCGCELPRARADSSYWLVVVLALAGLGRRRVAPGGTGPVFRPASRLAARTRRRRSRAAQRPRRAAARRAPPCAGTLFGRAPPRRPPRPSRNRAGRC